MQVNLPPQTAQTADKSTETPIKPQINQPDDRYPGTYFRIPGVPLPGKTTWSIAK